MTRNTSANDPKASKPAKVKKRPVRKRKAALTDAERQQRFKAMAEEVGAANTPDAFDRAFANVVTPPKPKD